MIYTASEIIERSKNLADMGNTDYISHKEASQYLNDAYSYVYQLAINRGDNFFVKSVNVTSGDYLLPDDFYQLRAVKNTSSGKLYTRKSLNAGINEPGYEIINNRLKLTGVNHGCELSYYPKPKIITFPDTLKDIDGFPIPKKEYSFWNKNLVYELEDTLYVYDVTTGAFTRLDIDTAKLLYTVTSNNYFLAVSLTRDEEESDEESNIVFEYNFYDFQGNILNTVKSEKRKVIFRNQSGLLNLLDDNVVRYKGTITATLAEEYVQAGNEALYYINDNKLYRQQFEEDPEEIDTDVNSFNVSNKFGRDYLVYEKQNGLFVYTESWDIVPLDIDYNQVLGYTDSNVIVTDLVAVEAFSNEPDILLNYPNNAYYTLLCYQLATYFVAKQGGDVTILQAQLEKAKLDFEDNAQDAFTYPRIKNVY